MGDGYGTALTVLILATQTDEHAIAVAEKIRGLGGRTEIVDLALFPQRAHLAMHLDCCGGSDFSLEIDGHTLQMEDFGAVWWRRPQVPQVSSDIRSSSHRVFAASESQEALTGMWHALHSFWVNDPARDQVAHRKAFQLRVAQDVGLEIPQTLITNDPHAARSFIDARGYRNVVYKSFSATEEEWRETRLLRQEELELLDNVCYAPVIFQEYVEAIYDLRITIVGGQMFAAAIYSQETSYPVDFRMDIANARVEPVDIPKEVEKRLCDLMDRLGLIWGGGHAAKTG